MLDVISDCMKPTTESSLSKNDSFMPVKRGHVEYESSLVDSPETSTTQLNSTQSSGTYRSGSSIPLLVYKKQEGMVDHCFMYALKFIHIWCKGQ